MEAETLNIAETICCTFICRAIGIIFMLTSKGYSYGLSRVDLYL